MKLLLISFCLLSFPLMAEDKEYMNNDGYHAPETIDRAVKEGEIQREEEELTEFNAQQAEEEVAPTGDAQSIQQKEEEKIEDNYLIGPYDQKGKMTYPNRDERDKKEELREELIE